MSSFNSTSLAAKLSRINDLAAELDALRPLSPEQEARVLQKFRLDWNYHSNSIEGNSLTYGETLAFLMEGLTAKGKPFKDHLDLKGHNEGINYLFDLVKNEQPLTEKVIRELHAMILVESYKSPAQTPDGQQVFKTVTLGAYKRQPNHVLTPTGETHYYATPEETPAKMSDLVHWLREEEEKKELHPVVLAAIFHYRFVAIHPFDDGNGRMSRLLMNLLLLQHHYPPAIIKQQERQDYFYALRQADAGELSPFVEFIAEHVIHSLEIQLRGARGESIEEEDDLDKEIALLKAGFRGKEDAVLISTEVLKETLFKVIEPLLNKIHNKASGLNDLFTKIDEKVWFGPDRGHGLYHPYKRSFKDLKVLFTDHVPPWNPLPSPVTYRYSWSEFKKIQKTFNVHCFIEFRFKYSLLEIIINGKEESKKIKGYLQNLESIEESQIIEEFLRSAIEEIKEKAGQ